jgi:hypothetical protein
MIHLISRWSTDDVIKVKVDFSRADELPGVASIQNRELLERLGRHVESHPMVLFLDADSDLIGKTGFQDGDPEAWLESARKAIAKMKAKDPMAGRAVLSSSRVVKNACRILTKGRCKLVCNSENAV